MKCHLYAGLIVLVSLTWTPGAGLARPIDGGSSYDFRIIVAQAGLISADTAARRAQSRYGGKVLSVRLVRKGQGAAPFYRVKLLSDGNVRVVRISAVK